MSVLSIFHIHKTKLSNLYAGFSKRANCHCTNAVHGLTSSQYGFCRGGLAGLVLNGKSKSLGHTVLTTIHLLTSEPIKAN